MLPLVRRLAMRVELDLYIIVYGERFSENVSTFDLQGHPPGLIDEATSREIVDARLLDYVRQSGSKVTLRLFKYPSLKIFDRQNFRLHRTLAGLVNRQRYDVVHLNGYRGSLLLTYAFLSRRTGKVWTIHDPILHSGEDKWQTRWGYRTFRWLRAHFIIHNRAQQAEFIRRYRIPARRCHFMPFGPLDIFQIFQNGTRPEPEPHTALFCGRISPYKGVEYLIEAGTIARRQLPALKVIIAGKPNYPIDWKAARQDPTFVVIDRFIPNEEMVELIQRSAVVVCPYTDATQSGVIMTAYAFHKPVLATTVGGLPEVVAEGDTGRLVPPRDAAALAEALVAMLSASDTLTDMSEKITESSQSGPLSWETIADQTVTVYQHASTQTPSSP